MKIVIFGLSVSSAWGNGHAMLLRGLFRALAGTGHEVHFFERDLPYYAAHRDAASLSFAQVHLYADWRENLGRAARELRDADVGMVTSYCPDGAAACEFILESNLPRSVFYDMDTPVTLSRLENGDPVPYLPARGLGGFDLVLSYTGGEALDRLREQLGARCVAPLYGWVDAANHHRVEPAAEFEADLSYLGTYSEDRQTRLDELLLAPARRLPECGFLIAGAMYPDPGCWPRNVRHFEHVSPMRHCAFYSSSPLTLSITRGAMAAMGYCPSGRLFEAAACGTAVLSDWWTGLDLFFEPNREILIAGSEAEAAAAIHADRGDLARIGIRARERALACHTAEARARRLISLLESPRNETGEVFQVTACGGA
ncbi:MAG: CgeB family protein [Bryobacteraceae bacterium]